MAHLVAAGNIRRRQHAGHTGQRLSRLRMDSQHPCTGVLAADGATVEHPVQIYVIRVLSGADDLFRHIHPTDPAAGPPVLLRLREPSLPEAFSRQQNSVNDLYIAGAAADIVPNRVGCLLPAGVRVFAQQCLGRDHHTRNAEAALNSPRRAESIGVDLLFPVRKALHRHNAFARQLTGHRHAGLCGLSVNEHRAGSAGALAAPVLHRRQPQFVPQKPQQPLLPFRCHLFSVHCKDCSHSGASFSKGQPLSL